ncbi:hypothetical protein MtrunA17_Chr5g0417491 [Medicago truncatula]|uniref:Uncharacterized protein n=1 Tax=Medicago truncatula TaxID=3880 RepID=A0A396HPZ6_MEDTR|nr:hypothetical protein MtrunA17_Chr5g0417491 [Medicago truncatula]
MKIEFRVETRKLNSWKNKYVSIGETIVHNNLVMRLCQLSFLYQNEGKSLEENCEESSQD